MNPISIVAFAGPAGSGKDTAGLYLIEKYGFKKLSFATPLKNMLAAMGCPCPATADEKEAIIPWLGVSWRHLGQTLGTEWGREKVSPDIWVLIAEQFIRSEGGRFVITDCRFENEAAMVRRMGGVVVVLDGRAHEMSGQTKGHVSEVGIAFNQHDLTIDNGGSMEELYAQLDTVPQYVGVPTPADFVPAVHHVAEVAETATLVDEPQAKVRRK
jgi:hypothetical protein